MYELWYGRGRASARAYDTIGDAMAATPDRDPGRWYFATGEPGQVFTDWQEDLDPARDYERYEYLSLRWNIRGPDAARTLIWLLTPEACTRRLLSASDNAAGAAVTAALPFTPSQCFAAAAPLAAHHSLDGELAGTTIAAAITAAGPDGLSQADVAALTARTAARLRMAGIAVYDDADQQHPGGAVLYAALAQPGQNARDSTAPPAAPFRLYHDGPCRGGSCPGGLHGQYASLQAAMGAAGRAGFGDWHVDPVRPGQVVLAEHLYRDGTGAPGGPPWIIVAPGAARHFAEQCPDSVRSARRWSPADETITEATAGTCGEAGPGALPPRTAARVAARLAAEHATGGLTAHGVFAALTDAYRRLGATPPPGTARLLAAQLTARLRARSLPVSGVPAPQPDPRPR